MYNHQLDTFIRVADAGSFFTAAEALYISSTAVMKQINLLEGSLKVQLFNRTPRGLTLTDAGKSYYQDAKYMIQYAKDAQVRAKNAMQSNESVIRIGTSLMTPSQFLMELWPQVHALHPELKFEMVNFDNTPENARGILANLGRSIDLAAGIFDETMLALRCCDAMELMRVPICCAVSICHPLAQKKCLSIEDLSGQRLMLMKRNWSKSVDRLRDELWTEHPEIQIVDFSFYNLEVFNQCEHENALLMAVPQWEGVHPLLKILPVDWNLSIPFGLLHSPTPSPTVKKLMDAIAQVMGKRQPKGRYSSTFLYFCFPMKWGILFMKEYPTLTFGSTKGNPRLDCVVNRKEL